MPSIKEYREKAGKAADEIYQLRDVINKDDREFTAEEQTRWDNANKEYDRCNKQIEILERADAVKTRMSAPADEDDDTGREDRDGRRGGASGKRNRDPRQRAKLDNEVREIAFQAWCRRQMDLPLKKRHIEACRKVGLHPNLRKLRCELGRTQNVRSIQREWNKHHESIRADRVMELCEQRALSPASLSTGAALIPDSFITALEVNMLAFGGVRAAAEIMRTESGEETTWPTANDTGNMGRRIGPNAAVLTTAEPTFGQLKWNAYKYTSDAVLVPYELLEDSAFDLASILGQMLGERLGRITELENTTGTGNSQPRGIVTAAGTRAAAGASAITYPDFVNLEHSVDPAYRQNAAYMMHDAIVQATRLLVDGESRPLWQSNIREGTPDRINGRPFFINMAMDSTFGSGKKTVLFGQLNRYKIREVRGVRLYRLQERYRDNDQDGFVAFLRQDGNLVDAGTAPVKALLH